MGIFGRKGRRGHDEVSGDEYGREPDGGAPEDGETDEAARADGPFDAADAPDDGRLRMDLGSVRVPVPDGARVLPEPEPNGNGVRAVHVVTAHGQVTVSAYAAPRTGGLWRDVSSELAEQLRSDGAKVTSGVGEWGIELSAIVNEVALRFVGVDGPRWMLRGVIVGPQSQASQAPLVLRDLVRGTVVVRGDAPMPVRTPLPIELPEALAAQLAQQQQQAQQQQAQGRQ